MRPRSRKKSPHPRTSGSTVASRTAAAVLALLGLGIVLPSPGHGCPYVEPTERIAIDLGAGQSAMLEIYVVTPPDADPGMSLADGPLVRDASTSRCTASIDVPLSAFPTSRIAYRPVDVARSMQDVLKKLDVGSCDIAVFYDNDTDEEIPEHELCLQETFAFGERKHWSISSESFCWAPEDFELVSFEESIDVEVDEDLAE